ncbi:hypothetical protein QBC44DRAFT_396214 [Cladorrhinum sp. PSN332]|nr:hypothetical protein QBC44DRAFT_396214 [Cladorrhinum sp. PSN332]
MDILLSLPVVSYFWSTNLTSWSTSLNLLFFYMTWSTLVLSQSPVKIEIVGTTAIHLALWLLPSIVFLLFDTLLPSLSETVKYSRRKSSSSSSSRTRPPRDAKAITKLISLAVFNLFLETALEGTLSYSLAFVIKTPVFKTTTTLPLPWQMMKHIGLLFGMREAIGYWIHRFLLHSSRLAIPVVNTTKSTRRNSRIPKLPSIKSKSGTQHNRLASLHCTYSHLSPAAPPFSLQRGTDHPFAFILHRFVPIYLPSLILSVGTSNLHLLTHFLFVGLTTLEETLSMSGYSIIPGLIMGGIAKRTAMHYESGGKGNYGSWGVMDWMYGTGLGGSGRGVFDDFRDEVLEYREEGGGNRLVEGLKGRRGGAKKPGGQGGRSLRRRKVDEDDEWREN